MFQQTELCAVCMDGEKKVGGEDENFNVTPEKVSNWQLGFLFHSCGSFFFFAFFFATCY